MLLLDNSQWLDDDDFKFVYSDILKELVKAYSDIFDLKNVARCVQELLVMSQDSGDTRGRTVEVNSGTFVSRTI